MNTRAARAGRAADGDFAMNLIQELEKEQFEKLSAGKLAGGQFLELLFFELLNEVHRKISIGGAPGAGCASVHLSCHCPDLALVYGKDRALSPICRAFRAF